MPTDRPTTEDPALSAAEEETIGHGVIAIHGHVDEDCPRVYSEKDPCTCWYLTKTEEEEQLFDHGKALYLAGKRAGLEEAVASEWAEGESDGMVVAFDRASMEHGLRESLFAAVRWLFRHRLEAISRASQGVKEG